jgi:hypothetical protein
MSGVSAKFQRVHSNIGIRFPTVPELWTTEISIIWTLRRTLQSFMYLAALKILLSNKLHPFCSRLFHTPLFSFNTKHGNIREWCPVTAVASCAAHHDQSIGLGTAHSDAPSPVDWSTRCPVMLEVNLQWCFVSIQSSLASLCNSVTVDNRTHVNATFLTRNDFRNKIQECWHKVAVHPV